MHLCTRGSYGFLLARATRAMCITRLSITSARNPAPTCSNVGLPWGPLSGFGSSNTSTIETRWKTNYTSWPARYALFHSSLGFSTRWDDTSPPELRIPESDSDGWFERSSVASPVLSTTTPCLRDHPTIRGAPNEPNKGGPSSTQGRRHALQHPQQRTFITIPPSRKSFACKRLVRTNHGRPKL